MSFNYLLADMTDEDFEYILEADYIVLVSKVGGGTLGRTYEGAWLYRVLTYSMDRVEEGVINTPFKKAHEYVARLAYGAQLDADSYKSE